MRNCPNCGSQIADTATNCIFCGCTFEVKPAATDLSTKEGSIQLARKLLNNYDRLENLNTEINDLEFQVKKKQVSSTPPRYSTFRFFWPFFIVALGASLLVSIVGGLMAVAANSELLLAFVRILAYLSIPVVLLAGLFIAKALRNKANAKLEEKEAAITLETNAMHQKAVALRNQQSDISVEMSAYKDLVPFNMRNKIYMQKVINLLETDQAATFEEAIEKLKGPRK